MPFLLLAFAQTHKRTNANCSLLNSHVKNKKYNNATPRARLISCLIIKPILIENQGHFIFLLFIDGFWSFGLLVDCFWLICLLLPLSTPSCFWTSAIKYMYSSQEQSPLFTIQLTDQTSCRTLA
jgi:hypothetical protein